MKIAYLSTSIIPSRTANSIHVMNMCQAFAALGHNVVLLAPDEIRGESNVEDTFGYYGIMNCFQIVKKPWLPFPGRGILYGYLAARHAKRLQPTLAYGRNVVASYFSSRMGIPTIFESHQPIADTGAVYERLFTKMIHHASLIRMVVITDALKKYYLYRYPDLHCKICVAPDAANLHESSGPIPEKLTQYERCFNAGYMGHLYPGRGIELLIDLAGCLPEMFFHILGGVEADVTAWKNATFHMPNIRFHGFVPPSQTPEYRRFFDVLLAPYQHKVTIHGGNSDTSLWMSPLKIFEYMASGKAIICSDIPVLREVLKHEHNALLCPPDDVNCWVEALRRLYAYHHFRKKLGENAQKDFLENYTWLARAKKVLSNLVF